MNKLQEWTNTLDDFLPASTVKLAYSQYHDLMKTKEGQIEILEDAKNGIINAINYLFYIFKPLIAKCYDNYYVGPNKSIGKVKYHKGADEDYAIEAYGLLLNASKGGVSPLSTFSTKLMNNPNPVKAFTYYFKGYLQSLAFKLLDKDRNEGMTFAGTTKIKATSIDQHNEEYSNSEVISSIDSSFSDIDTREATKAFIKYLKRKNIRWYKTFVFILMNPTVGNVNVAEKLDISYATLQLYVKALELEWKKFIS